MSTTIEIRTGSTGMQLETGRAQAFGLDPEGQPWITCCTAHGTLVGCSSKAMALVSDNIDFCEDCRALTVEQRRGLATPLEVDDLVWIGTGDVTYRVDRVNTDGTYRLVALDSVNRPLTRHSVAREQIVPQGRQYERIEQ